MVVIDQEDHTLERLFNSISRKLGVRLELLSERVASCKMSYGGGKAEIIIAVNGITEYPTSKHTIEDHLLKIAENIGVDIPKGNNSKLTWRRIDRGIQLDIFRKILDRNNLKFFKPQVIALELLLKSLDLQEE